MKGKILWFTGLSGAGKTTLANLVTKKLKKKILKLKKLMVIYLEKKIMLKNLVKVKLLKIIYQ